MKRSIIFALVVLLSLCLDISVRADFTPEEIKAYTEFLGESTGSDWEDLAAKAKAGANSLNLSEIVEMLTGFLQEEGGTTHAILENMEMWLEIIDAADEKEVSEEKISAWDEAIEDAVDQLAEYLDPLERWLAMFADLQKQWEALSSSLFFPPFLHIKKLPKKSDILPFPKLSTSVMIDNGGI